MQTCHLSQKINALPKGVGTRGFKNSSRDKEINLLVHRVGILLMISCKIRLLRLNSVQDLFDKLVKVSKQLVLKSFPDDFETLARYLRTEFLKGVKVIEIFPMLFSIRCCKKISLIC